MDEVGEIRDLRYDVDNLERLVSLADDRIRQLEDEVVRLRELIRDVRDREGAV